MMKSLFSSKFLACKVVIPFVWYDTSKASLSTYFANFWWVRQKVPWSRNDCTLFVSVVLHDFSPVRHVFEWWLVVLLNDLGWCKVLLVASCQDCSIILLPCLHRISSFLERLTTCVVWWMTEETFVYATFLDIVSGDILRCHYHCSFFILAGYTPWIRIRFGFSIVRDIVLNIILISISVSFFKFETYLFCQGTCYRHWWPVEQPKRTVQNALIYKIVITIAAFPMYTWFHLLVSDFTGCIEVVSEFALARICSSLKLFLSFFVCCHFQL